MATILIYGWMVGSQKKGGSSHCIVVRSIGPKEKLQKYFECDDVLAIQCIPLARHLSKDCPFWFYEDKCIYFVKSGYKLPFSLANQSDAATSTNSNFWQNKIWRLTIPNKVEFFLWKGCLSFISTHLNLNQRGVAVGPWCPRCHEVIEHDGHCFFDVTEQRSFGLNPLFLTLLEGFLT